MKTLFTAFWRRNLAFFRLAVLSQFEYRLNYLTDAILQPFLTSLIELMLWLAVFSAAATETIGGFPKTYYLAYALWASFVARITSSWMYEFRMIQEIESGTINGLLVRPMSFFEYYLSQLLGYKFITSAVSLIIPLLATQFFGLPTDLSKVPLVLLLITYYMVMVHAMSFCVSSIAFHLNRTSSLTMAKNLALWLFSGELVPLDLVPSPFKEIVLNLPFCNAVYIPVGYLTGRVSSEMFLNGFVTTTYGIIGFTSLGFILWRWGLSRYVGTGA